MAMCLRALYMFRPERTFPKLEVPCGDQQHCLVIVVKPRVCYFRNVTHNHPSLYTSTLKYISSLPGHHGSSASTIHAGPTGLHDQASQHQQKWHSLSPSLAVHVIICYISGTNPILMSFPWVAGQLLFVLDSDFYM